MIKFFRKIRQKLIIENRFNKYLLYAVGEIILVIIGILIALQINNWNESRKDKKYESYLLQQIEKEFQYDRKLISSYIKLTYGKTIQAKRLRKAVEQKRYNYAKDSLVINAFLIGKLVLFDAYTPTFDELLSSGKLNIITNDSLKAAIKSYKNINDGSKSFDYDESQQKKEAYNTHLYQYFEPQIMTYLWESFDKGKISIDSLNTYKMDIEGFMNDPKTLYHINTMIGIDRNLSWTYKERRLPSIEEILQSVHKEIKKQHD